MEVESTEANELGNQTACAYVAHECRSKNYLFYRASGTCVFAARGSRERLAAGAGIGEVFGSCIVENSQ